MSVSSTLQLQYQDASGGIHNSPYPFEVVSRSPALVGRYNTGRVLWYEDFEAPGSLQPWYTYDGKKWRVSRSSMKARMGRYSLHMSILGNTLVDTARVLPVDLSGITKLGLECWFTFSNNFIGGGSVGTYFGPSLERWNGTYFEEYQCIYQPTTPGGSTAGTLVLDIDGSPGPYNLSPGFRAPYDPLSNQQKTPMAQNWHHMKFIVDISKKLWVSVNLDGFFQDMTPINLGPWGASGGKSIPANAQDTNMWRLELHHAGNFNAGTVTPTTPAHIYYDDIVLTDES